MDGARAPGRDAGVLRSAGVAVRVTPRCCTYDPSAMVRAVGSRCETGAPTSCTPGDGGARSRSPRSAWSWASRCCTGPSAQDRHARRPLAPAVQRLGGRPRNRQQPRRMPPWGVPPARGTVVYNGFDATRVIPRSLAGGEASPDGALRGHDRSHERPQGLRGSVISAARELAAADDARWAFALIGDGAQREALKAAVLPGFPVRERPVPRAGPGGDGRGLHCRCGGPDDRPDVARGRVLELDHGVHGRRPARHLQRQRRQSRAGGRWGDRLSSSTPKRRRRSGDAASRPARVARTPRPHGEGWAGTCHGDVLGGEDGLSADVELYEAACGRRGTGAP